MLVYNDYHLYGFNALSEAEHKTVQDILNMCIQYPEAHILFKGRRLCQTELEDKKAIILLPEGKEIESIIHNAVNSEQTVKFTNGTL